MTAVFVRPLAFSVATTSPSPISPTLTRNMSTDIPGQVWRGGRVSYFIVDLGDNPAYDTLSLVGTNLLAANTVRVRTGTTNTGIGGHDVTVQAWSGIKPDIGTAITVIPLSTIRNERYVRIDINAGGNAIGYVEVQRLVIGLAARVAGIEFGAEASWEDRSEATSGPGYESHDVYDHTPSWKFRTAFIYEDEWRGKWIGLMRHVAQKGGVLFVPEIDAPANWITDAIYGRMAKASGKAELYNAWVAEGQITALSM